jgi:hypothetical protein
VSSFLYERPTVGHARYAEFAPAVHGATLQHLSRGAFVYTGLSDILSDWEDDAAAPVLEGRLRIALNSGAVTYRSDGTTREHSLGDVFGLSPDATRLLDQRQEPVEITLVPGPRRDDAEHVLNAVFPTPQRSWPHVAVRAGQSFTSDTRELRVLLVQTLVTMSNAWTRTGRHRWQLANPHSHAVPIDAIFAQIAVHPASTPTDPSAVRP